ncbi:MAG: hypothetical protein U0793_28990 [Gemmataceae bacterium]
MAEFIKSLFGPAVLGLMVAAPLAANDKESTPPKAQKSLRAGLVLVDAKTAYLVNPLGGVDALDLQTGKVLWTAAPPKAEDAKTGPSVFAQECFWPMAVTGRLLVVRERNPAPEKSNTVRIVLVDLDHDGAIVKRFPPTEVPVAWWNDHVVRSSGGAAPKPLPPAPVFRSESRIESGRLFIAWESVIPIPATKTAKKSGVIEVDLESGKVRDATADKKHAEINEPEGIVVGERKLLVVDDDGSAPDVPKLKEPPKVSGVSTTTIVPMLRAIDLRTGKVAWQRVLRGGSTVTINSLAPTRP